MARKSACPHDKCDFEVWRADPYFDTYYLEFKTNDFIEAQSFAKGNDALIIYKTYLSREQVNKDNGSPKE